MSNSTAIALITASCISGLFCLQYIAKMAADVSQEIVSGVSRGQPMSIEWRWLMLLHFYVPYAMAAVGCPVVVGAVNVTIAEYAADARVELLAYLVVLFAAISAVGWLLGATLHFTYFRSLLRQAEAD
jgi:uncharacterized membrane protein YciS (DUF1049 family)